MSIQKPDIGFRKIANELRNYTTGSREESLSSYQGELVFDTRIGVGRNLPKKPIAFSDFIHATQYINTNVQEPRFVWPSPLNPITLDYDESNSYAYQFDCKIIKPAEEAQWGNAIPKSLTANLAGNSNTDINGITVITPTPPSAGNSLAARIKILIPRDFSGTRYYSIVIHTSYIYPLDPTDANWKTNPLSQGVETFSSQSASLRVSVQAGGSPVVALYPQTDPNTVTNTSGFAIKYENGWKNDVCTTKQFAAFGFDMRVDGRTKYHNEPAGYKLVDAVLNYRCIFTPYDPNTPQFSPTPLSEIVFSANDYQGYLDAPQWDKSKFRFSRRSKTICYDPPPTLGIGPVRMHFEADVTATYDNLLTGQQETFSDTLNMYGGSHRITKVFEPEPIVLGPAYHTAFFWRYITNDQQQFDQRAVDLGADQISGVMEHANFELVAQFNKEAIGKRFNVYIGPGGNGYYISGISTGQFGVPQFSPSVSREWTVPSSREVVIGCFIATGTAKEWKGPGSYARAILEYIEDGKSQHRWRGTEPGDSGGAVVSVQITDQGHSLLSGVNGPSPSSYRYHGDEGTGATFDFTISEGRLTVMKVRAGGTGYKVGETFDIDTVRFGPIHPEARDAHARITQVTTASTNIDWSPDADTLDVPVFDKPAHLSKNSGLTSRTVMEEGNDITYTIVGENLAPGERTGFWTHTFPGDAILSTPGTVTTEYVGSGTGYRYKGTILTANRPNHYEDVTGTIKVIHTDSQAVWFESDTITIKNTHDEPGVDDPEIVTPNISVNVVNRGGAAPGAVAEMTAEGRILLRKNGKFTRHQMRTGGFAPGTTTYGICATDMTGTDWDPRITPDSGSIDSYNESDIDLFFNTVDERPTGYFQHSLHATGRTFALHLFGEQVRQREAQVTGSAQWELYNSVTKEIIPGGSITGMCDIQCGDPGDDTPVTSPPGGPTITRQYCEYLLTAEFMGRTGYQITEYSDGTVTKLLNEEECGPAFTDPPTTTSSTTTTAPLGTTWCAGGNRYASTTSFPFVVLVRANDPTCTDDDTTTTTTTTRTTTTTTTAPAEVVTWCNPIDGHRYKMSGTFPNLVPVVVVYNDPTCAVVTTTTTTTTTAPPPTGPAAGTIVPNSEACYNGTKFWREYTGIGFATVFKSQANHPDCVVATTTQPPITTTRTTTTAPPPVTVSFRICVRNPVTGLQTGYQTIIYSDGSRETIYNPTDCAPQSPSTTTTTTRPPQTTRPVPTIRPGFDSLRNVDNRRTDR